MLSTVKPTTSAEIDIYKNKNEDELYFTILDNYETKFHILITKVKMYKVLIQHINNRNCLLEILHDDVVRCFFDFEGLEHEEDFKGILKELESAMKEYIDGFTDLKPTITKNKVLSHGGLSFHIYYPFKINKYELCNFIKYMKYKKPEVFKYFDDCVYSKNRLFRSVNQIRPLDNRQHQTFDKHNMHIHYSDKFKIDQTIIQNVKDLKELHFRNIEVYELKGKLVNLPYHKYMELCEKYGVKETKKIDLATDIANDVKKLIYENVEITIHIKKLIYENVVVTIYVNTNIYDKDVYESYVKYLEVELNEDSTKPAETKCVEDLTQHTETKCVEDSTQHANSNSDISSTKS